MSPKATATLRAVPDAPRRALGLVRVSKARDDMISPELQRTAIEDHAARRGHRIVAWMEGLDESASRERSKWWKRLDEVIALVEAHEIDVVLVWKVSRAARHRRRWAVAIDRIEVAGGALESATEGLDVTTSTGRLARGMLAELAAWESDVKSEQWKEAHARRRRLGLPAQGGDRWGYVRDGDTYRIDPASGPALATAYRAYIAGDGFSRIARALNQAGLRSRGGGVWTRDHVTRLLDSGFGAGLLVDRRQRPFSYLPGAHPAVIDEATWHAYLAARGRRRGQSPGSSEPRYTLSGLLRCGDCGASMQSTPLGVRPGYGFICARWASSHEGRCVTVTTAKAERGVLDWLATVSGIEEGAATQAARANEATLAAADAEHVARQIVAVDARLNRLTSGWTEGLVPDSAYAATRDELAALRSRLEGEHAAAVELAAVKSRPAAPVAAGLLKEWGTLPVRKRQQLLRQLVKAVVVVRPVGRGRVSVRIDPR